METIDPVLAVDVAVFALIMILLFEGVRRTVGWPLLGVLLVFFAYAFIGKMLPGAFGFRGFTIDEVVEIMTMTTNGVLGITTATSLQFVFYFVLFGAVYSGIGGRTVVHRPLAQGGGPLRRRSGEGRCREFEPDGFDQRQRRGERGRRRASSPSRSCERPATALRTRARWRPSLPQAGSSCRPSWASPRS